MAQAKLPKRLNTSRMMFDPQKPHFLANIKARVKAYSKVNVTRLKISERSLWEYIVLMYDPNSPLWIEEPDYYKRKYEAAVSAGFIPDKKGRFEEVVEKVLTGQISQINDVIVDFISLFGLPEYYQLLAYLAIMSEETKKILAGDTGGSSHRIIEFVGDNIKSITRRVFNSGNYDEVQEARQALYSKLGEAKVKLRPEQIVQMLKDDGKLPDDFSPYDESLEDKPIEPPMNFIGDQLLELEDE